MRRKSQVELEFGARFSAVGRDRFGGSESGSSNPKERRPVATKSPMHLVLRSSLARGDKSFLSRAHKINKILNDQAVLCGVKLHRHANAGNHLHLLVEVSHRNFLIRYLKAISGLIAREVMNAKKSHPGHKLPAGRKSFWDARPFSRIVSRGRDFLGVKDYIELNQIEVDAKLDRPSARTLQAMLQELRESWLRPLGFI